MHNHPTTNRLETTERKRIEHRRIEPGRIDRSAADADVGQIRNRRTLLGALRGFFVSEWICLTVVGGIAALLSAVHPMAGPTAGLALIGVSLWRLAAGKAGRRTVDALRTANAELRQIFNAAVPLCVVDRRQNVLHLNDSFCAYFGVSRDDDLELTCDEMMGCDNTCNSIGCPLRQILAGKPHAEKEITRTLRDGREVSHIVIATPFRSADGETIGIVEGFVDITDRKRAERQLADYAARLEASNRLLDEKTVRLAELNETAYQFVNNVAHEFRTPLSVVREFTSIIDDGLAGPVAAEQHEYLEIISHCVDDLALMVDDMLDVGKLEAGRLCVRRSRCAVAGVVQRVKAAVEQKAASAKCELSLEFHKDLPAVYCDAAQIGRVIINLAVNAVKFAGEGGHVRLWARYEAKSAEVIIGVTDDGPGIDADKLKVIFERFQQVGSDARATAQGVGLGLNIAKELVALNFGQIAVESRVGVGSTFSFTVPTADPAKILRRYLERPDAARDGRKHLCLIAAAIDGENVDPWAAEVDEFLHGALRSDDLVLRIAPGQWMLVVEAPADRAELVVGRLEQSWEDARRRHPGKEQPKLRLRLRGNWSIARERDEFVSRFRRELDVMQPVCV